jgi:hypothetical protein
VILDLWPLVVEQYRILEAHRRCLELASERAKACYQQLTPDLPTSVARPEQGQLPKKPCHMPTFGYRSAVNQCSGAFGNSQTSFSAEHEGWIRAFPGLKIETCGTDFPALSYTFETSATRPRMGGMRTACSWS